MYLTYSAASDGDVRDAYYIAKTTAMSSDSISLIKHFQGEVVTSPDQVVAQLVAIYDDQGESVPLFCRCPRMATLCGTSFLCSLYAGDTFYDVDVTQTQHALQTAKLAQDDGASDALVTSALLHDVGHLLLSEHADSGQFLEEDLEVRSSRHFCVYPPLAPRMCARL